VKPLELDRVFKSRIEGAPRLLRALPARRSIRRLIQTFHVWLPSIRRSAPEFQLQIR